MSALTVLRVLRRTTVTRATFTRAFATTAASSSSTPASGNATAIVKPNVTGVPSNPNVKTIRKELMRALDADVNDLSMHQDENITQYIKDNKFQIKFLEESNQVLIARMVGDNFVEAKFDLDPDQNEDDANEDEQGEQDQQNEEQNENEGQPEGEGQEEDELTLDRHTIHLIISKSGATVNPTKPGVLPNTIVVETHVDTRGFLHVDSIATEVLQSSVHVESHHPLAPKEVSADAALNINLGDLQDPVDHSMDFNELGDATKDHFYRYLEALGIDDQFGQFVQHYAQILRTQNYTKRMQQLRSFLSL